LALAASLIFGCGTASADPLGPVVVQADFRNAPDQDLAISELQRHLDQFREDVRRADLRNPPPFGTITVQPASGLERAPLGLWKTNTIAMVWGRMSRAASNAPIRPRATLFIGPLRIRPMLPPARVANRFNTLDGVLGGDAITDLVTYANYVGYAILLRVWANEPPLRAATIARVLYRRIGRDMGGPNGSSACLDDLQEAVHSIDKLASRNLRPDALSPPLTTVAPIECTPLQD